MLRFQHKLFDWLMRYFLKEVKANKERTIKMQTENKTKYKKKEKQRESKLMAHTERALRYATLTEENRNSKEKHTYNDSKVYYYDDTVVQL